MGFFKSKLGGRRSKLMHFGKYNKTQKKCYACSLEKVERDAVYYVTYTKKMENKMNYGTQPMCKAHFQNFLRYCLNSMYNLIKDKLKSMFHQRQYKTYGAHFKKYRAKKKEVDYMIDELDQRTVKEVCYSVFLNNEFDQFLPQVCDECGGDIHDKFALIRKISEGCEDLLDLIYNMKNSKIPLDFKFGALCCKCYRDQNQKYFESLDDDEKPTGDLLF